MFHFTKSAEKQAMHGRSMVEVLAVIGIMGLLAAGAVIWLPDAIHRHRGTNLFKEFSRRSVALTNSPVMEKADKGGHVQIPGVEHVDANTPWLHCKEMQHDDRFVVIARDVTREDCRQWAEMAQAAKNLYPQPIAANFASQVTCTDRYAVQGIQNMTPDKLCGPIKGANATETLDLKVAYPIERQSLGPLDLNPTRSTGEGGGSPCKKAKDCSIGQCCLPDAATGKRYCVDDPNPPEGCGYVVEGEDDITGFCRKRKWKECVAPEVLDVAKGRCVDCETKGHGRVRAAGDCSCTCDASRHWVDTGADDCECADGYRLRIDAAGNPECVWCNPSDDPKVWWNPDANDGVGECQCKADKGYYGTVDEDEVDCTECSNTFPDYSKDGKIDIMDDNATVYAATYVKDGKCACVADGILGENIVYKGFDNHVKGTKSAQCGCPDGRSLNRHGRNGEKYYEDMDFSYDDLTYDGPFCVKCQQNEDCPGENNFCIPLELTKAIDDADGIPSNSGYKENWAYSALKEGNGKVVCDTATLKNPTATAGYKRLYYVPTTNIPKAHVNVKDWYKTAGCSKNYWYFIQQSQANDGVLIVNELVNKVEGNDEVNFNKRRVCVKSDYNGLRCSTDANQLAFLVNDGDDQYHINCVDVDVCPAANLLRVSRYYHGCDGRSPIIPDGWSNPQAEYDLKYISKDLKRNCMDGQPQNKMQRILSVPDTDWDTLVGAMLGQVDYGEAKKVLNNWKGQIIKKSYNYNVYEMAKKAWVIPYTMKHAFDYVTDETYLCLKDTSCDGIKLMKNNPFTDVAEVYCLTEEMINPPCTRVTAEADTCFTEGMFSHLKDQMGDWAEYVGCRLPDNSNCQEKGDCNTCGCFGTATYTDTNGTPSCTCYPTSKEAYTPNLASYTPPTCSGSNMATGYSLAGAADNLAYAGSFACQTDSLETSILDGKNKAGILNRNLLLRRCSPLEQNKRHESLSYYELASTSGKTRLSDYFTLNSSHTATTSTNYNRGKAFVADFPTKDAFEAKAFCYAVDKATPLQSYNDYTSGDGTCKNKVAISKAFTNKWLQKAGNRKCRHVWATDRMPCIASGGANLKTSSSDFKNSCTGGDNKCTYLQPGQISSSNLAYPVCIVRDSSGCCDIGDPVCAACDDKENEPMFYVYTDSDGNYVLTKEANATDTICTSGFKTYLHGCNTSTKCSSMRTHMTTSLNKIAACAKDLSKCNNLPQTTAEFCGSDYKAGCSYTTTNATKVCEQCRALAQKWINDTRNQEAAVQYVILPDEE